MKRKAINQEYHQQDEFSKVKKPWLIQLTH